MSNREYQSSDTVSPTEKDTGIVSCMGDLIDLSIEEDMSDQVRDFFSSQDDQSSTDKYPDVENDLLTSDSNSVPVQEEDTSKHITVPGSNNHALKNIKKRFRRERS